MIRKINFRTLGCRLNHAESDAIQFGLQQVGYAIVNSKSEADLTIINSCAVTSQAEAKTRGAIAAARRISPNGKIAVVGCYSQLSPENLMNLAGVDLVLGNSEKYGIADFLATLENGHSELHVKKTIDGDSFPAAGQISKGSHTRALMKIQDGCDYKCSYCVIPQLRGASRSRNFQDCIEEARLLVDQGFNEIVLSGINIGSYHMENGKNFTDLVEGILTQTHLKRLRISSIEPDLIDDRLISIMRDNPRFCRHFHIPLQHGSNEVLGWMRRRYRVEHFVEKVYKIYEQVPGVCIGTDILVGYPGESDEHFHESRDLLKELPLAYFHVFRYSPRPGTVAAQLKDSVSVPIKKERSEKLRQLSKMKKNRFIRPFINREISVLFEKKTKMGLYQGLSDNYITINVYSENSLVNHIETVKILSIRGAELQGELVGG